MQQHCMLNQRAISRLQDLVHLLSGHHIAVEAGELGVVVCIGYHRDFCQELGRVRWRYRSHT